MGIDRQETLILFFVRFPEPGAVKNRLAARIGPEVAAELYGNFILDILRGLKSKGLPFRICFHPEQKGSSLRAWLGEGHAYRPQRGMDLGERMRSGFLEAFSEGYKRVALVGSDLPDLPLSFFTLALNALRKYDSVIGPSVDGGYYLIGFREEAFLPDVFQGMNWGTEEIFSKTLSLLEGRQKRVRVLPPWRDVDTLEDLRALVRRTEGTGFVRSKTMGFLARHQVT